jgi:hypothetical protein
VLGLDLGEQKENIEGISLMQCIISGKVNPTFAISQLGPLHSSIRNERFKLFRGQLYDLQNDPQESKNAAKENERVKKGLQSSLEEYLKSRSNVTATEGKADDETLEELRKLGYID